MKNKVSASDNLISTGINSLRNLGQDLVNPHPYKYILTPDGICKPQTFIVVFVHSAPMRINKRQLIRQTWGNVKYHMDGKLVVMFVIGSSRNLLTRKAIRMEHTDHRDILSEDFTDDYRNLTHKAIGALRWIIDECQRAKFIVKTDDDTLMNVFSVVRHLTDLDRAGYDSGLLMCRCVKNSSVLRTKKWAVTRREYPESYYPPYCSGLAYIMTADVARALYETSYKIPIFWIDDVWLTGIVAKAAGVRLTNINRVYSLDKTQVEKMFLSAEWYQYLFAHLGPIAFKNIWNEMLLLASSQEIPETRRVIPGIVVES